MLTNDVFQRVIDSELKAGLVAGLQLLCLLLDMRRRVYRANSVYNVATAERESEVFKLEKRVARTMVDRIPW